MMPHREKEMQQLEHALTETFRSRSDSPFSRIDVTQDVMRDIRRATSESRWGIPSIAVDQLVWRAATIVAGVILVVTVLTVEILRTTPGESAGLLAEEFESGSLFGDY